MVVGILVSMGGFKMFGAFFFKRKDASKAARGAKRMQDGKDQQPMATSHLTNRADGEARDFVCLHHGSRSVRPLSGN
jgi:hypothetical protein